MYGISKWYKSEFEKLGWMVIAYKNNNMEKIDQYKKSIQHLLDAYDELYSLYNDNDKKYDILVMKKNTEILQMFVNNHMSTSFSMTIKNPSSSHSSTKLILTPVVY
jgi:hypothetical protein